MAIKISSTTVIDDNKVFLPNNASATRSQPTISAGTLTLDLNTATIFDVTLNSNITTLTITNVQSAGRTSSFILMLTADGTARSVTWPASFDWPSNVAPSITSTNGKRDIFTFFTSDGGTNWNSVITGQNF
jgi:hypothetical protein